MVKSSAKRRPPLWAPIALAYDQSTLDRLVALGATRCTPAEAARIMGHPPDRLNQFFQRHPLMRDAFEQSGAEALKELRAAQFKLAKTSTTMAIFLGKQHLGQADRRELYASEQASEAAGAGQRVRDKLAALVADRENPDGAGKGEEF